MTKFGKRGGNFSNFKTLGGSAKTFVSKKNFSDFQNIDKEPAAGSPQPNKFTLKKYTPFIVVGYCAFLTISTLAIAWSAMPRDSATDGLPHAKSTLPSLAYEYNLQPATSAIGKLPPKSGSNATDKLPDKSDGQTPAKLADEPGGNAPDKLADKSDGKTPGKLTDKSGCKARSKKGRKLPFRSGYPPIEKMRSGDALENCLLVGTKKILMPEKTIYPVKVDSVDGEVSSDGYFSEDRPCLGEPQEIGKKGKEKPYLPPDLEDGLTAYINMANEDKFYQSAARPFSIGITFRERGRTARNFFNAVMRPSAIKKNPFEHGHFVYLTATTCFNAEAPFPEVLYEYLEGQKIDARFIEYLRTCDLYRQKILEIAPRYKVNCCTPDFEDLNFFLYYANVLAATLARGEEYNQLRSAKYTVNICRLHLNLDKEDLCEISNIKNLEDFKASDD
eukprot:GHVT01087753.1.p1 GENE.GHVT01087753.1~~GHVT01087753.1.p1  ORF type:complete len:446 (-),score=48.18 GHVT01087753.1:2012-3349(-)